MSHTIFLIPNSMSRQRSNYLSAVTLKSIKTNFVNIHRQVRHHERVCHAQDTNPILKVKVTFTDQKSSCLIMSLCLLLHSLGTSECRVLVNAVCCVKVRIFIAKWHVNYQLGVPAYANFPKLYHPTITILSAAVSVYYIFWHATFVY